MEQVHAADVIDGSPDIGSVRLSVEFHAELSDTLKKRFGQHAKVEAKNIGAIELYSENL